MKSPFVPQDEHFLSS